MLKTKGSCYRKPMSIAISFYCQEHPLFVQATVTVSKDLEVNVYHLQNTVPQFLYSHILESRKVKLQSQIINLLAFAKNLETNKTVMEDIFKSSFMQLVNKELEISENNSLCRFLKFMLEQVNLLFKSQNNRRYSIELLMFAYVIHAISPCACERLLEEDILVLLSVKTLKKITMKLNRTTRLDDSQYLKIRFGQLNAFDLFV